MKTRRTSRLSLHPETLLTLDPAVRGGARPEDSDSLCEPTKEPDGTSLVSRDYTFCHNCPVSGDDPSWTRPW